MKASHLLGALHDQLDRVGVAVAPLALRLLLAWEYWESGWMKFTGSNWFAEIQGQFPFPLNVVPPEISWFLATWSELLGAIALVIGLATRYVGVALLILTLVAWYSVHAGHGYNVCDNGYKLALIYSVMLLPLILLGAGRLSVDHWLHGRLRG
ncbi:MAG: DoxX family protein [Thiohalospira sp.]